MFRKYHSIENSYNLKFIEIIKNLPCSNEIWIVTEKVHGANMNFTCTPDNVIPGKRNSQLLTNDDKKIFYSSINIINKTKLLLKNICQKLKSDYIIVYGELFGGLYKDIQNTPIQQGIHYSPNHNFYVFDIYMNNEYLPHHQVIEICKDLGLFYAPILFEGLFDEALKWSDEHKNNNTHIPKLLGLSEMEENIMEGHVLKPVKPCRDRRGKHIFIKNKNDKFGEINGKKYKIKKTQNKTLTEQQTKYCEMTLYYITKQRYDNVVSKEGLVTIKDIKKIAGLMTKDVLKDFYHDNSDISTKDKKNINSFVNKHCTDFVKDILNNINVKIK